MIMITMRRNLGSILIMTTTISSITIHMKKEQGKVLFDNQINNGSMYLSGGVWNWGRDGGRSKNVEKWGHNISNRLKGGIGMQ